MSERKLTQEQIDHLFELCEFHNVHYYDVQIELVDHIASAIEAIWETNPDLSFEEAVFRVGEQFGVEPFSHSSYNSILPSITGLRFSEESGFEAIKEAKEKELRRKYDRLQWKYIGEFFKLPRIILTLIIAFLLFVVFRFTSDNFKTVIIFMGIYLVASFIYLTVYYPKLRLLNLIAGKPFLLLDQLKSNKVSIINICLFTPFNLCMWGSLLNKHFAGNQFGDLFFDSFFTAVITFSIITMIVTAFYIPKRIKADFIREFPQFVKS